MTSGKQEQEASDGHCPSLGNADLKNLELFGVTTRKCSEHSLLLTDLTDQHRAGKSNPHRARGQWSGATTNPARKVNRRKTGRAWALSSLQPPYSPSSVAHRRSRWLVRLTRRRSCGTGSCRQCHPTPGGGSRSPGHSATAANRARQRMPHRPGCPASALLA